MLWLKKIPLRPKTDETQTFTLRVPKDLVEGFDELANKSKYSRNALIVKAMRYWYEHVEFTEDGIDE